MIFEIKHQGWSSAGLVWWDGLPHPLQIYAPRELRTLRCHGPAVGTWFPPTSRGGCIHKIPYQPNHPRMCQNSSKLNILYEIFISWISGPMFKAGVPPIATLHTFDVFIPTQYDELVSLIIILCDFPGAWCYRFCHWHRWGIDGRQIETTSQGFRYAIWSALGFRWRWCWDIFRHWADRLPNVFVVRNTEKSRYKTDQKGRGSMIILRR